MAGKPLKNSEPIVYCVFGEQDYLREKYIMTIKKKYNIEVVSQVDYAVYYADNDSIDEVITILMTLPFLAEKRLVILKKADKIDAKGIELIKNYCKTPSKTSIFVIECSAEKFAKQLDGISSYVECIECVAVSSNNIKQWVKNEFSQYKKTIDLNLITIITENVGHDLSTISSVVEQISLFVGDRDEITKSDVEQLVGYSIEHTGFELIQALEQNNLQNVVFILRNMLQDMYVGKRPYELMGLLAWHYRRMAQAKLLLCKKQPEQIITKKLRIPYFVARRFFSQLKTISEDSIWNALNLLLEADYGLKTGQFISEDIELLIIKLMHLQKKSSKINV